MPVRASRRRYALYRERVKRERGRKNAAAEIGEASSTDDTDRKKKKPRTRSFFSLLKEFWGLLYGHRGVLAIVLLLLGVSTLLGLAPLYGTKIVFDSVLREQPLPVKVPAWVHLPSSPKRC